MSRSSRPGCSKAAWSITKAPPPPATSSGARRAAATPQRRPTVPCCWASSRSPTSSSESLSMKFGDITKIKALQTPEGFRENLRRLGLDMPCDDVVAAGSDSPLGAALTVGPLSIGNRFAIQPMEGWDGTLDGKASDNTIRRWRHFGLSGAKLIWGGEAVAVRHDGRANPNQLVMSADNQASIAALRDTLIAAHREAMGDDAGLVIGLQLTHSGRFCKPND